MGEAWHVYVYALKILSLFFLTKTKQIKTKKKQELSYGLLLLNSL